MKRLLMVLGFEIQDGRKPGHKKVKHPWLSKNYQYKGDAKYTCGHGRNPELKRNYPKSMAMLVKRYEIELTEYLNEVSK